MAKAKTLITNPVFQKNLESKPGFNVVSQANPFNSIFEIQPLDEKTLHAIDRLMYELVKPENANEEQVRNDLAQLKTITLEVKAIEKQGVLLIGERLFKAREILGKYGRGIESFTAWLNITFKHRSTAYNVLSYYELYKMLPNPELQKKLKEMPHKAAYVLASRKGEIEQKVEIVEKCHEMRADDIIAIIQDKFPILVKNEKKASIPDVLIDTIRTSLRKLLNRKRSLKDSHFTAIAECQNLLDAILQAPPEIEPMIEVQKN